MAIRKQATVTIEKPIKKPVREKLRFVSDKSERMQLAAKSRLLLGYGELFKHIAAPGALGVVLRDLHIDPLSKESVETYKEQVLDREKQKIQRRSGYRTTIAWRNVKLQGYTKPIPEFVLNKAVQIAEKMPSAQFCIQELHHTSKRIDPDPFLVVSYGDESYYIEVWDEPTFESKM